MINVAAIMAVVRNAEMVAINRVAQQVAASAKAKAPIRKVFKETKARKFRSLTPQEKQIASHRATVYYTNVHPSKVKLRRALAAIRSGRAELPVRGAANNFNRTHTLRLLGKHKNGQFNSRAGATPNTSGGYEPGPTLSPLLTKRGRNEVRSGRAIHTTRSGHVRVGGALKASIHATEATVVGQGVQATVVAGIGYAKFVEFPTVHNAAQPFIRPALAENRVALRHEIAAEIKDSLGG